MRNLIPHPTSPQTRNLGEPIRRYVKDTIRKGIFFLFPLQNLELLFYRYNSCFIISLIRPNLDLKPSLMSMQNISFPSFFMFSLKASFRACVRAIYAS